MKLYKRRFSEQLSQDDIQTTIFNFFKVTPEIADSDIHALAEKMGIAPDALETHIYRILRSIIGEGKSKGVMPEEATEDMIKLGMSIEAEHTSNRLIQRKIVADHLVEDLFYYDKLVKIEKQK